MTIVIRGVLPIRPDVRDEASDAFIAVSEGGETEPECTKCEVSSFGPLHG